MDPLEHEKIDVSKCSLELMECGALLDVCRLARLVSAEEAGRGKARLVRIVAMLTKMCRS